MPVVNPTTPAQTGALSPFAFLTQAVIWMGQNWLYLGAGLLIAFGVYAFYISPHTYRPYFGAILDQGYKTIYAEPWGKYTVDPQKNININLAKIFKISNFSLTLFSDVYNLLNSHDVRWDYDVFQSYGPYFGKIFTIQMPRTYRVGFRISY